MLQINMFIHEADRIPATEQPLRFYWSVNRIRLTATGLKDLMGKEIMIKYILF
jgi:hypothetical protein